MFLFLSNLTPTSCFDVSCPVSLSNPSILKHAYFNLRIRLSTEAPELCTTNLCRYSSWPRKTFAATYQLMFSLNLFCGCRSLPCKVKLKNYMVVCLRLSRAPNLPKSFRIWEGRGKAGVLLCWVLRAFPVMAVPRASPTLVQVTDEVSVRQDKEGACCNSSYSIPIIIFFTNKQTKTIKYIHGEIFYLPEHGVRCSGHPLWALCMCCPVNSQIWAEKKYCKRHVFP